MRGHRGGWLVLGVLLAAPSGAHAAVTGVDPDEYFEVVYEISGNTARTIANARVVDLVRIGSVEFLVIEPSGLGVSQGYLSLPHVRSILPSRKFQKRDD